MTDAIMSKYESYYDFRIKGRGKKCQNNQSINVDSGTPNELEERDQESIEPDINVNIEYYIHFPKVQSELSLAVYQSQ